MKVESTAAAWEQLCLSQISNGRALHAPLDELESCPPATWFCLHAVFAISLVRTFCYFFGAVQDRTDGNGGTTRRHHFSRAVQMELSLRVTENLGDELTAKEQVPLVDEALIMAVFHFFDQFLMRTSRLSPIAGEIQ